MRGKVSLGVFFFFGTTTVACILVLLSSAAHSFQWPSPSSSRSIPSQYSKATRAISTRKQNVLSVPTLSPSSSNCRIQKIVGTRQHDTRTKCREILNASHSSSTALRASPLDIMVTMYKDSLMENPVETKMLTGGILAFVGDAIAQSREPRYDEKRAAAFVSFDVVYRAVQCSLFPIIVGTCDGHFLAPLFPTMDIRSLATMEQTFANQFLVIPFIYYPVFFTLTGYLQGLSMDATIERAQNTLFPLLKRNWLFWIPVQYFQFGYVEEPLQIPFLCVAGLAWTFILSALAGSVKSYGSDEDETQEAATASVMVTVEEELSTAERVQV